MEQRTILVPAGRVRSRAAVVAGLAGLVVVTGVLSGCDSEAATPGGSSPSPSVTSAAASPSASSASPSASASPSVAIPAAARVKSDKGAEAFVRFFVVESARAWTSANPGPIEALSDPDCASCASLAGTAKKLREAGHHYAAVPITVSSAEALTGDGNRQNVAASIRQHAVDVVDKEGVVVGSDKADNLERIFLLYWKEGQWVVGGIA
ncbi:MAG: DUF6318 family protein [Ornithinibacter sp.]